MGTFKCYDWLCSSCGAKTEYYVNVEESNWDSEKPCLHCDSGYARRCPSGPPVQKASFLDGTKRRNWENLKEASKLEAASFNLPPSERTELKKEVVKLKRSKSHGVDS